MKNEYNCGICGTSTPTESLMIVDEVCICEGCYSLKYAEEQSLDELTQEKFE